MNTSTRIGKIARLPHSIREQLNLKLHDNVPAKSILPWLNSLTDTKTILAADFENRPITKQNLSDWKHGGFRDWLLQFNAAHFLQFCDLEDEPQTQPRSRHLKGPGISPSQPNILPLPKGEGWGEGEQTVHQPATPGEFKDFPGQVTHHAPVLRSAFDEGGSRITSKLLLWTQLQYVSMARHIDSQSDPDRKFSALRHFANDISRLQRSDLARQFLQIQRDWLAFSQSNTAEKKEKQFWDWTKRPDIEKKLFPDRSRGMTAEELYQVEKDLCLLDGPGPEVAELMAEVRLAKKLLEARKAQQAQAKAKAAPDYDPHRPLPKTRVKLAGMPFEELFPTIPETPLTQPNPELDDALPGDSVTPPSTPPKHHYQSHPPALRSASDEGGSDSVQPGPAQSSQIQPPPSPDPEPNPSDNDRTPDR